jgi:hypothetical protein
MPVPPLSRRRAVGGIHFFHRAVIALSFSWSCSSIGFLVRRAVVSVVSCLEAYNGAGDAAPRANSAAARAGQHVMTAAIVPAHQISLNGPLTEHHGHRILNVSWRDIAMRVDLP